MKTVSVQSILLNAAAAILPIARDIEQQLAKAEQAKLVMQCLDLATKHGGLNAAAAILPVAKSIESQLTAEGQNPET